MNIVISTDQGYRAAQDRLGHIAARLERIKHGCAVFIPNESDALIAEREAIQKALADYAICAEANENAIIDAFLGDPEGGTSLPACCYIDSAENYPALLYAAYNRGGNPDTAGLNYAGAPCPTWDDLPKNVQAKWNAVASITSVAFNIFLRKPR